MTLQFVKMHANGDDFIVIDRRGKHDPITPEIARRLGDRHRGIGFNQLAVVLDCEDASARIKRRCKAPLPSFFSEFSRAVTPDEPHHRSPAPAG